jgi:hypothetical protein
MSTSAVPDDGEMRINGMWRAGRQLRAASGRPVAWVSDSALGSGLTWADLGEKSAKSGLQPFLLYGVGFEAATPLSEQFGEQVSEPEDTTAIDVMDVAQVLEGWWWAPDEGEFAEDEELRGHPAPGRQAAADPGGCAADRRRALRFRRRGPQGLALDQRDRASHSQQPVLGLLVGLKVTAPQQPGRPALTACDRDSPSTCMNDR